MKRFQSGPPTPDDIVIQQLRYITRAAQAIEVYLKKGGPIPRWAQEQILASANSLGTVQNVVRSLEKK